MGVEGFVSIGLADAPKHAVPYGVGMHSTCHHTWNFLCVFVHMGSSYMGLSCTDLSYKSLYYVGFSTWVCPVWVWPTRACLSYMGLSYMGLSYKGSSYMGLSYMGLSFVGLSYMVLPSTGLYKVGLSHMSLSYMGLSYMCMSYMGLSYMGPCPLSQAPSPILQVGSQQTGTAPVTAQVTPPTCRALPHVPTVPPIHGAARPQQSWRCPKALLQAVPSSMAHPQPHMGTQLDPLCPSDNGAVIWEHTSNEVREERGGSTKQPLR